MLGKERARELPYSLASINPITRETDDFIRRRPDLHSKQM